MDLISDPVFSDQTALYRKYWGKYIAIASRYIHQGQAMDMGVGSYQTRQYINSPNT